MNENEEKPFATILANEYAGLVVVDRYSELSSNVYRYLYEHCLNCCESGYEQVTFAFAIDNRPGFVNELLQVQNMLIDCCSHVKFETLDILR